MAVSQATATGDWPRETA